MTGFISETYGWELSFYVAGAIAVVSFLIFTPFVTSTPEQHRFITKTELNRIKQGQEIEEETEVPKAKLKVPWIHILTSRPVLALIIAKFSIAQTRQMISIKVPAYMSEILHIPPGEVN